MNNNNGFVDLAYMYERVEELEKIIENMKVVIYKQHEGRCKLFDENNELKRELEKFKLYDEFNNEIKVGDKVISIFNTEEFEIKFGNFIEGNGGEEINNLGYYAEGKFGETLGILRNDFNLWFVKKEN